MKRIAVIIDATEPTRVREALRAAIGLGLRGDQVTVYADGLDAADPWCKKALATLQQLGQSVTNAAPDLSRADAVEVWT
jgi:hypothetical protein